MRIAVIGAGIVGVTTAYELTQDGHEVHVFDRCSSVAAESSFANTGVVAPGYVAPLATPGLPRLLLKQMLQGSPALRLRPGIDGSAWRWLWRAWRACQPATYRVNRGALVHLAEHSQQRLTDITRHLKLDFEQAQGLLVLLRDDDTLDHARRSLPLLQELGIDVRELPVSDVQTHEPGLCTGTALKAVWQLPHSLIGNCRQVAHLLKDAAEARGASFHFGVEVLNVAGGGHPSVTTRPSTQADRASALSLSPSSRIGAEDAGSEPREHRFDAVVLCAGADSARLLASVGLHLPLQPIYGYAVSAPVRDPERAPVSAVIDERYRVTIARLGNRIRVAGCAELGGDPDHHRPDAIATLHRVLNEWFPGAVQPGQHQIWKGARPMLPDGPPLIGPGPQPGLWLNLGHGASGWALSCGSAQVLADLIAQRSPAVDVSRFRLGRWRDALATGA